MKKQALVVAALAAAITLPMVGCGGTGNSTTTNNGGDAKQEQKKDDSKSEATVNEDLVGQWHGSVAITGTSVYGTTGGEEAMLDVYLNEDGTCTIEPVEAHADLLTDEGTWTSTDSEITLKVAKGDITLKIADKDKLEGTASDFDIADFDTINFDYYG